MLLVTGNVEEEELNRWDWTGLAKRIHSFDSLREVRFIQEKRAVPRSRNYDPSGDIQALERLYACIRGNLQELWDAGKLQLR